MFLYRFRKLDETRLQDLKLTLYKRMKDCLAINIK